MSRLSFRFSVTTAGLSGLTLCLIAGFSHAQTQDESASETSLEIVQFAGAMHGTSLKCGAYPEDKLLEYKHEQQQKMQHEGMKEDAYEQAFAKGRREAERRWASLSEQEQKQACREIENQVSDLTPPSE